MVDYDFNKLRKDLVSYFGTASNFFPSAQQDIVNVNNGTPEEVLEIAKYNRIDLEKYKIFDEIDYDDIDL